MMAVQNNGSKDKLKQTHMHTNTYTNTMEKEFVTRDATLLSPF